MGMKAVQSLPHTHQTGHHMRLHTAARQYGCWLYGPYMVVWTNLQCKGQHAAAPSWSHNGHLKRGSEDSRGIYSQLLVGFDCTQLAAKIIPTMHSCPTLGVLSPLWLFGNVGNRILPSLVICRLMMKQI